jgi:hypothetical protein
MAADMAITAWAIQCGSMARTAVRERTVTSIFFMGADFTAQVIGYGVTDDWGDAARVTRDHFEPLETFALRFDAAHSCFWAMFNAVAKSMTSSR